MDQKILWKLSYGVYAVCSLDGSRPTGCIANSAMQITSAPPSIAISINHDNYTHGCIEKTGRFSLCVLPKSCSPSLIGQLGFFSGRDTDKFEKLAYETADGLPVLKDACGYILCEVRQKMDAGTHTVFLGQVTDAVLTADLEPMTYEYYHNVIKGKSPKNAPTYRGEPQKSAPKKPEPSYRCSICGYVYNGETPFGQLPPSYTCPICGAPKSVFSPV